MNKKIKVLFTFPPGMVGKPITYCLVKDYDLWVNILHAEIAPDKAGKLVLDIEGREEDVERALDFLACEELQVQILNGSISWDEDRCLHCGACTSVCPAHALTLDPVDWSLKFDREKCYVCKLCTLACPVKAMSMPI
ncbi:MAG: 4Fe-4S binding protein [Clostridia bacterium]|nr:4Fe-4S binding protein [Clostridia bacterium]